MDLNTLSEKELSEDLDRLFGCSDTTEKTKEAERLMEIKQSGKSKYNYISKIVEQELKYSDKFEIVEKGRKRIKKIAKTTITEDYF